MIKTILFDLDATLLPMHQDEFMKDYFKLLAQHIESINIEPKSFLKEVEVGTYKMLSNDGRVSNEIAFWSHLKQHYDLEMISNSLNRFYQGDFKKLAKHTSKQPLANEVLQMLKAKGYQLILATNPLFPKMATYERMSWNNINHQLFSLVTTYENSSYTKPNKSYYDEILGKFSLNPLDCLMVGNDMHDDFSEIDSRINTYLITDCLMNKHNKELIKNNGSFEDFYDFALSLPSLN